MRLAVLLALLLAPPARADPRDQARARMKVGQRAFDSGRVPEALHEFQAAYALEPLPELHYKIGLCHERLGDTAGAIAAYEHWLAVTPPSRERAVVEKRTVRLRARLLDEPVPTAPLPAPPPVRPEPLYRRWWLWTAVGGAVVAFTAVGIGVGVASSRPGPPPLDFPALAATR